MELRELKYFLAVAREESISKAAGALFMTQPSLSRQMQNLEKEIGKQLFIRGSKKITLTETGILLRKRAEEMMQLYEKTQVEIATPIEGVSGDIYIGSGESYAIECIAKLAKKFQSENPDVRFHFFSGDSETVAEKLDRGLLDFGIFVEPADVSKYESITLPLKDTWGVYMRKDSPLAQKEYITPEDLYDVPLIRSRQTVNKSLLSDWFQKDVQSLHISAVYNLIYNASLLVKAGMGYAVGLERLINITGDSELTFRQLKPKLETSLAFAWKRYQVFSTAANRFMELVQKEI